MNELIELKNGSQDYSLGLFSVPDVHYGELSAFSSIGQSHMEMTVSTCVGNTSGILAAI